MKDIRRTISTAACLVGLAVILGPTPSAADHVILDDLIVDGSACIGFDCVNGESFGFDTLRLKENNLRIHFDDTSTAASYPDTDWRIVINDSANGGGHYFAVEDASASRVPFKIEANARTNSLYIDDGGRLGLRTSTPSVEIHTIDGDTPTLRLQQDGSSGFAPHTWDVAGNETNFFIRDVTEGSALPLRIRPGAPSSSLDIASDGFVGMGTGSPDESLHIESGVAAATRIKVENTNATARPAGFQFVNDVGDVRAQVDGNGDFGINTGGAAGNEFLLDSDGNLEIDGGLVTGTAGSCTAGSPCDAVFRPAEYTLESIDEHAAYMWQNEHLRGVGPTPNGEKINLTRKTTGLLQELEKAHVYIEQLHRRLQAVEARMAADEAARSVE